ncbi:MULTISPECIES: HlyD family type I secretion periplasmic adaptor subunit [Halomonadaceae]|uniref:Membrane fusion protein (MFP) family protein n=1 Tax=Vreelandella titanicae TaxID=664683 RepID=A0A558J280_9GAMM|nr:MULTISPECIES: HlyD family type I secretion periplasmic adaptor subunit [Halomonas]MBR9903772.1 HlyD family type I secretion periplasmic adaptor subunit [Gammaproteobacteria bacterium]TVU87672.1 HlyD family type I secretion periplasmic adaptor subunit [Halomonas titanicae]CEP36976.1 Type I secretion membrane fusion protein, HlyD [Halomonas sp. R57-5]
MSDEKRNPPTSEIDITPNRPLTIDGEACESLPISDKGYRKLGFAILIFALGGFVLWAATASLAIAVVAPGSVSIESFKRTVQHLEGGIVEQLLVEDGDQVAVGDTLIVLSDTQASSQLAIARSQYLINRAMEARLLAEQQGAEAMVIPDDLQDTDNMRVQQVVAVQQSLFTARRQSLKSTLEALDEQIVQMREQIVGLEQRISVNTSRNSSLNTEAGAFRSLYREGLGDSQRLRELERQVLQYEGDNAEFRANIAQLRSQISENRMQREIQQQEFQKEVGEQLREAQAQIAEAEERIISLSDQVERAIVTAPVSGIVVGRQIHTVGAVIRAGDTIMDIVPSNDGFVVEARIPTRDIDNIHIGQFAEIRFSAFNQRLTDVIDGEVIHVSADSFEDEATGQHYYRTRIRVTEQGYTQMNEQMQLLSGMPAEVMLRTGERTFASYIAKPITDMLARALRED